MTDARIRAERSGRRRSDDRASPSERTGGARSGRLARVVFVIGLGIVHRPARPRQPPQPEQARLRQVVELLASPEFGGRSGAGGRKGGGLPDRAVPRAQARAAVRRRIRPADPRQGARHAFRAGTSVRMLRGSDPALRDEWVIVAAHFDHLGVRRGMLYPGADDNASGVAMMLEVARSLVASTRRRPSGASCSSASTSRRSACSARAISWPTRRSRSTRSPCSSRPT